MNYLRISLEGKPEIDKKATLSFFLKQMPTEVQSFIELFKQIDSAVRTEEPSISNGGLNNAHGDWYEWLLALRAWNLFAANNTQFLALLLPNVKRFDVASLYEDSVYRLITDLRQKISDCTSVQLITSNPDFVIIDPKGIDIPSRFRVPIDEINPSTLAVLEEAHQHFVGMCEFENIVGYGSVKTSLRPDRRLQIPHEGSLMKAIYTHIQTRKWILSPRGIKYYAIAQSAGEADIRALRTVATHSITTVNSIPEAAVDELFTANSFSEADAVWIKILN